MCRLYFDADALSATVPTDLKGVTLDTSQNMQPLPGEAGAAHRSGRYVLEHRDMESGDAMVVVQAAWRR